MAYDEKYKKGLWNIGMKGIRWHRLSKSLRCLLQQYISGKIS